MAFHDLLAGRDSDAGAFAARHIGDGVSLLHAVAALAGAHFRFHRLHRVGVLAHVGYEVVEHPPQQRHVGQYLAGAFLRAHVYMETLRFQTHRAFRPKLGEQRRRVQPLLFHGLVVFRVYEEVLEQLVRHFLNLIRLLLARVHVFLHLLGRMALAQIDDVQIADQAGQRRAQVVRHGREQLGGVFRHFLLVLQPFDERPAHLFNIFRQRRQLVPAADGHRHGKLAALHYLQLPAEQLDVARLFANAQKQHRDEQQKRRRALNQHGNIARAVHGIIHHLDHAGAHRAAAGVDQAGIPVFRILILQKVVHRQRVRHAGVQNAAGILPVQVGGVVHRQHQILPFANPLLDALAVGKAVVVFRHVGKQLGEVFLFAGVDFFARVDSAANQRVARRVHARERRRRGHEGKQRNHQKREPQVHARPSLSQCDSPFPIRF